MAGINGLQRVTLTVGNLLLDRMDRRDVSVTYGLPRSTAPTSAPRLNLFLFHVKENPAFRNAEDPRRAASGAYGSPPLALELGYLLTSYSSGATIPGLPAGSPADTIDELDAQEILADAMRVLHDTPIVTRTTQLVNSAGLVLDPSLQFEFESLRITPRQFSLDELTKLWTALKEDYQRSVAYEVSVIRIERPQPSVQSAPVLTRNIPVQGSATLGATLTGIDPTMAAAGEAVTLQGTRLNDPSLAVLISDAFGGGFPATPQLLPVARVAAGVQFTVPNTPATYMPGPKLVSLVVTTSPGHQATSAPQPFLLLPRADTIAPAAGPFDGTVSVQIDGALLGVAPAAANSIDPLVPTVLFGGYPIPAADVDFTQLPNRLTVTLNAPPAGPNVPAAGQVLPVRVRLNGVESRSWQTNPVTRTPEMNPALQFTVT
jgi:hypothetical protein